MKKYLTLCLALCLLIFIPEGFARPAGPPLSQAMADLHAAKNDPGLLVLTNAPYVRSQGKDCLGLLDQAQDATGARVGKGNLLFFQRPQAHPFCLMLFNRQDRQAVIFTRSGSGWSTDRLSLAPQVISDPAFWKTTAKSYAAGRDLFTLAAIASAWAEGAPYDFLKATELHNHLCPGVTSGYLMARFILKHYPLKAGERYTIISSPVWCKEDALQVVLDCTPGKKGLVAKPLSEEQTRQIPVPNPAGFLLVWDSKAKTGKGVALSFDFGVFKGLYPENTPKAATILSTVAYLDQPEKFVSVSKQFDLDESLYTAMTQAGTNPYEAAGLVKD